MSPEAARGRTGPEPPRGRRRVLSADAPRLAHLGRRVNERGQSGACLILCTVTLKDILKQGEGPISQSPKLGIAGVVNLLCVRVEPIAQVVSGDDVGDKAPDLVLNGSRECHGAHLYR